MANPRGFKAFTFGTAVADAANGKANTWIGKKHGMYATWGGDYNNSPYWDQNNSGKPWAILTSTAEYGSASVSRLGDYDLDVAPQFALRSWSEALNPNHAFYTWFTARVQELKDSWGTRSGRLYYRPFHEFNGNWFPWSVRNTTDQANFITTWRNMRAVWNNVINGDLRFHLSWSPNRDSKYNLDVRDAFPGSSYVDAIGLDYYDFGMNNTTSETAWTAEATSNGPGGSPQGLFTWRGYAEGKGLPIYLPEYGIQFGDNRFFCQKVVAYAKDNGYPGGTGDPDGKFLGAVWHNLQGSSPDPSAGGDFWIHDGVSNYSARPLASEWVRNFHNQYTWRQAV